MLCEGSERPGLGTRSGFFRSLEPGRLNSPAPGSEQTVLIEVERGKPLALVQGLALPFRILKGSRTQKPHGAYGTADGSAHTGLTSSGAEGHGGTGADQLPRRGGHLSHPYYFPRSKAPLSSCTHVDGRCHPDKLGPATPPSAPPPPKWSLCVPGKQGFCQDFIIWDAGGSRACASLA